MILNRKGQTLIMFVLLLPLILALVAFIVDFGLVITEKTHQIEVIKTAIKDNKTLDNEEIKKVIKKNKVDINNIKIENNNEQIRIVNETKIDSIFGAIIGLKEYRIKVDVSAKLLNGKIIFEN